MGRPKKDPDLGGPPTAHVRINRILALMASAVSMNLGISTSDYLSGIIGDRVIGDYEKWRAGLIETGHLADSEDPDWRSKVEQKLARSPDFKAKALEVLRDDTIPNGNKLKILENLHESAASALQIIFEKMQAEIEASIAQEIDAQIGQKAEPAVAGRKGK